MATILVIDDDRPLRAFLRSVLEEECYHVIEASNGRLGLELYRAESTDLIITDLVMPEMDGLNLIYELTRSFENVKVIAMTGGVDGDSRLATAKLLGARQTLQKPFTLDKFLGAVRDELAH
jgi:two-component system response regulator (stage 0 sporulation protein F)